ncbi:MAG: thiamine pyrophosphate-binding protein, partial [Lachnospiraceae bacterium]|nr:thiamine pyrophosphate-binding protein [Lachnospiraceae bacterium]
KAKRPLICVGGGVALSNAEPELRRFVEKSNIPVVSTMMGIGAMPTEHPLYFGMVGNNGKPYANKAIRECDTLLMVGARVADRAVNQPDFLTDHKVMIHMDVDPAEIGKNIGPTIPIVGDAKAIFEDLNKEDINASEPEWLNKLYEYKKELNIKRFPDSKYVDPQEFIEYLSDKMDEDGIYVADVGQNQIWSCAYHVVKKGRFLTSGGMGTMGYSIPAALGAKLANPKKQVIAVCGDGSFQMSMCELATIKQENANVKIIVFKNGYLGMVREYQHFTYKDNYSVVELNDYPNLEALAKAYDFDYYKVTLDKELSRTDKFLASDNPGIMEVNINPMDIVKG